MARSFVKESQDLVKKILGSLGDASAYDVMNEADRLDPPKDANTAFAARQRISAACSELHALNQVHQVGTKANPSSGEQVGVYRLNRDPRAKCPCGACPDGGKGYKGKYEQLKEEMKEVVEQNETLIMFNDRLREEKAALQEEVARLKADVKAAQERHDACTA